ncbi:DNA translocase FtsK [Actinomadura rubrisoli]|uniref:FtsK gamma domain-containing protein n=1 Tax=Actinomadura rubrisoli TaxID=2530368 RepID=A0A4R5CGK2_9ACTN|nr:DNA translocase FtsK [Actinomadura rubrisoli]TDD97600.1 hypothetical protein E1298_00795 [Actinomadura rubrisoli]
MADLLTEPRSGDLASEEIAARLVAITANLDAHIEERAIVIAAERITAAEDAAEQKVAGLMASHASEVQRLEDLIKELRRQLKPLRRHIEETCPEVKERRARFEAERTGRLDLDVGHDRDLLLDAARVVIETQRADRTTIQRKARVGFAKAGRLLELLEQFRVIGPVPATTSGKRPVLLPKEETDGALKRLRKEIGEASNG